MPGKSLTAATCGLLIATTTSAPTEAAVVDNYLKFSGIEATEQTDKGFKGASDILSFNWGITANYSTHVGGGSTGAAQVQFTDFSWAQLVDSATPKLLNAISTGKAIANADVSAVTNGITYFSLHFENVYLTGFNLAGSGSGTGLNASFLFELVTISVTPLLAAGGTGTTVSETYSYNLEGALSPLIIQQLGDLGTPVTLEGGTAVPIPASLPLLAGSLALLARLRRRQYAPA